MAPKPGFFDALTRIDELILRNNQVLEALEAIFSQEEERELQNIYFAYPADGTFATLQSGTTILDFRSGTITDVNEIVTKMGHSLQSEGRDLLRSFFVNSDKLITIQPDSLDTIPADKEKDAIAAYQEFTKLTIVCTEETKVFVICSTSPEAAVRLISTTDVNTGDLAGIKTALEIMDDWDDGSDRCNVSKSFKDAAGNGRRMLVDVNRYGNVLSRPTGEIETTGAGVATGGGGVVVIATRTVTNAKTYHICNLHVACKTAHWLYLYIGGTERRRYYNAGDGDTVDWFAWDWHPLTGDVGGTKKIELKAEHDDAGETLYGDFCGEEI